MLPQETHLRSKDTHRLKVQGWKEVFHANSKEKKKAGLTFISNKIDFKTKANIGNKESHSILIKGTIQQEGVTLISIYTPNIGAPKHIEQIRMDTKGETDSNTVGALNTLSTSVDRTSRQKTNKDTVALNDTLEQMDLFDIFRAFHPYQQNIQILQGHMECFLGQTTCYDIK